MFDDVNKDKYGICHVYRLDQSKCLMMLIKISMESVMCIDFYKPRANVSQILSKHVNYFSRYYDLKSFWFDPNLSKGSKIFSDFSLTVMIIRIHLYV